MNITCRKSGNRWKGSPRSDDRCEPPALGACSGRCREYVWRDARDQPEAGSLRCRAAWRNPFLHENAVLRVVAIAAKRLADEKSLAFIGRARMAETKRTGETRAKWVFGWAKDYFREGASSEDLRRMHWIDFSRYGLSTPLIWVSGSYKADGLALSADGL